MVLAGTRDPRIAVASMTCALGITSLGEGSLLADGAGKLVWLVPDSAHWCWLAPATPARVVSMTCSLGTILPGKMSLPACALEHARFLVHGGPLPEGAG